MDKPRAPALQLRLPMTSKPPGKVRVLLQFRRRHRARGRMGARATSDIPQKLPFESCVLCLTEPCSARQRYKERSHETIYGVGSNACGRLQYGTSPPGSGDEKGATKAGPEPLGSGAGAVERYRAQADRDGRGFS